MVGSDRVYIMIDAGGVTDGGRSAGGETEG